LAIGLRWPTRNSERRTTKDERRKVFAAWNFLEMQT
jgi:hypothetical protein